MTGGEKFTPPVARRGVTPEIGKATEEAALDVLYLRRVLARHDLDPFQRDRLLAAAMTVYLAWEIEAAHPLGDLAVAHPPVPEQAITAVQARMIEDNHDLWVGWAPGCWPVRDALDPRGWRWADPLDDRGAV